MDQKILDSLKKYQKRGFVINEKTPNFEDGSVVKLTLTRDYGCQYNYFHEDIDPQLPHRILREMEVHIS